MYFTGKKVEPQQLTEISVKDENAKLLTSSTIAVIGSAESVPVLKQQSATVIDDVKNTVSMQSTLKPPSQEAITDVESSSPKSETIAPPTTTSSEKKLSPEPWVAITLAEFDADQSVSVVTYATKSRATNVMPESYAPAELPKVSQTDTAPPTSVTSDDLQTPQSMPTSDTQIDAKESPSKTSKSVVIQTPLLISSGRSLNKSWITATLDDLDARPSTAVSHTKHPTARRRSSSGESTAVMPDRWQSLPSASNVEDSSTEKQITSMTLDEFDARRTTVGASASATQSLPAASKAVNVSHPNDSSTKREEAVTKSREELPTTPVGLQNSSAATSHILVTSDDFDGRASTAASNQTHDASRSESAEQPHFSSASSAVASRTSSYVTVTSTADTDMPHHMTQHQLDTAYPHQIPAPTTSQSSIPIKPRRSASKTDGTMTSCTKPCELVTVRSTPTCVNEVETSRVTETTKPQDTKRVLFTTNDEEDEGTPINRRPTPFVWDSPRDSSLEVGSDDVGPTKTFDDSKKPSSQPDVAYHPQRLTSDASGSSLPPSIALNDAAAADVQPAASRSSVPPPIAYNAADDVQPGTSGLSVPPTTALNAADDVSPGTSRSSLPPSIAVKAAATDAGVPRGVSGSSVPPSIPLNAATADVPPASCLATVTKVPPPEAEVAPLKSFVDGVKRKSVHISNHLSAFLPTLPGHGTDDILIDENDNFTAARRVPSTQMSDDTGENVDISPQDFDVPVADDTRDNIDISPLDFEVPEAEEGKNHTWPESLYEPLPLAYDSSENEDEVDKLEKQSAAVSVNVDDVDDMTSTLEPKRSLREIVLISLREEKQVKGTDNESEIDDEKDADAEIKTPTTNNDPPTDYSRPKSVIDRLAPAPPSVSESGIVMTLSDFDDDNLMKKVRMSSVDEKNESLLKAKEKGTVKVSKETEKGKLNKTGVRLSDADEIKKKRKSTFVEELLAENKRRASARLANKVTPDYAMDFDHSSDVVVPARRSSTLLVALNRDADCEIETGDSLHVAARPSSMSFRYIISPDAQYAGGRSQSKSSVFQPSQCKPLSVVGVDSSTHFEAVIVTATKPTESNNTHLGSTSRPAAEVSPALVNADYNNKQSHTAPSQATKLSADAVPAAHHIKPSLGQPSQPTKPSPVPISAHRPTNQLASPVPEPALAFIPTNHYSKPPVGHLIHKTLAELDSDEDFVTKDSWPKSSITTRNGDSNQIPVLSQVSAAVETNSLYAAETRQPFLLSLSLYQQNSPDQVITFSLDSYDRYNDERLSYPVIIRRSDVGGTSQKMEFSSRSHEASDVETQDDHHSVPTIPVTYSIQPTSQIDDVSRDVVEAGGAVVLDTAAEVDAVNKSEIHHNEPAMPFNNSMQPTNSIDDVSAQATHRVSDNVVTAYAKTEIRTSPVREHEAAPDINEPNLARVTSSDVTETSRAVVSDTAAEVDAVNKSGIHHLAYSDTSNVVSLTPTLPEEPQVSKTRVLSDEEEFRSWPLRASKGKSGNRMTTLLSQLNRRKNQRQTN